MARLGSLLFAGRLTASQEARLFRKLLAIISAPYEPDESDVAPDLEGRASKAPDLLIRLGAEARFALPTLISLPRQSPEAQFGINRPHDLDTAVASVIVDDDEPSEAVIRIAEAEGKRTRRGRKPQSSRGSREGTS